MHMYNTGVYESLAFSDLANPKTNRKTAGFTNEERQGFTDLLDAGYIDSFRELYPEKEEAYTFWTYMGNARGKNIGWYVLQIRCLSLCVVPM